MAEPVPPGWGKYLRVCGEEAVADLTARGYTEIPPRVRRRAQYWAAFKQRYGNTSACAEKSSKKEKGLARDWKYLRVCGEESLIWRRGTPAREIPPRMRRRGEGDREGLEEPGNTSAYAEKSLFRGG